MFPRNLVLKVSGERHFASALYAEETAVIPSARVFVFVSAFVPSARVVDPDECLDYIKSSM